MRERCIASCVHEYKIKWGTNLIFTRVVLIYGYSLYIYILCYKFLFFLNRRKTYSQYKSIRYLLPTRNTNI